ncbi:pentatricopeptide repeat-containing protein At3g14580, mitochondrial [Silene latifolia]|uniref:pentatricopeptide repeat-containing protein At3g14580, mitochondrial n=1 Tax=Silene latifolia TaxID=37657 RepID=UPI003D7887DA
MTLSHRTFQTILRSKSLNHSKLNLKFNHKYVSSTPSYSSSNYTLPNQAPNIQKLYHKDWLSPNEVVNIFNTLQPNSVLSVFDHVSRRKDYKPNEALYNVIITKLAQDNNFTAIDDIMKIIKTQKSLHLSDEFFHDLIKVYGNVGGLINRAIETLFDMPNYHCWPSVKTFNLVLNLLVSSKSFDLVHEVFMGAAKLGVEIDACSLNILIKGLCERGLLDDALQVFDEFPQQGCKPSKMTYSTIMNCMCKKGDVDGAFELLGRMEKDGVSPDAVTFNVLVSGLQKQGRVTEAMELLDKMSFSGCKPNKGTYQEVLYGLLKEKRFLEAKDFVQRMRSKALIPSFASYKELIEGLSEEKLIGDVEWVLKSMVLVGFVPKMGMWRNVLHKVFSRHDTSTVVSLSKIVKE